MQQTSSDDDEGATGGGSDGGFAATILDVRRQDGRNEVLFHWDDEDEAPCWVAAARQPKHLQVCHGEAQGFTTCRYMRARGVWVAPRHSLTRPCLARVRRRWYMGTDLCLAVSADADIETPRAEG